MSVVTGVMLLLGAGDWDEEPFMEVQQWLRERAGNQLIDVAEEGTGGGKHPQFEAWCAGLNYFDEDEFAEFVLSREWLNPENMVLILQPEAGPTRVFVQQRRYESAPQIIIHKPQES
jgi:hypothetical protein